MGQQQILLIVLSVIIVGIAVSVGITMFRDQALQSNRDAIIGDITTMSARAQQFRIKPTNMGGGGNTYTGMALANLGSAAFTNNDNASYALTVDNADQITIVGTGKTGTTPWIITAVIDASGNPTFTDTQTAAW
jgi:hypothetical protein